MAPASRCRRHGPWIAFQIANDRIGAARRTIAVRAEREALRAIPMGRGRALVLAEVHAAPAVHRARASRKANLGLVDLKTRIR